jgi:hypothetical protein
MRFRSTAKTGRKFNGLGSVAMGQEGASRSCKKFRAHGGQPGKMPHHQTEKSNHHLRKELP